jgi:hypothetical protein
MAWRGSPAFRAGASGVAAYIDDLMRSASIARGGAVDALRGISTVSKGSLIEGGLFSRLRDVGDIIRSPDRLPGSPKAISGR